MTGKQIIVSDHALIRYVERVLGFCLDKARADIAAIVTPAGVLGATQVCSGGFTYVIRNGTVTTIIDGSTPIGAALKSARHNGRSVRMRDVR